MSQAKGPLKYVSLVVTDDLRKMEEEEPRKLQQKRVQMLREAVDAGLRLEGPNSEEPEDQPPWASAPAAGLVPHPSVPPWEAALWCEGPRLSAI